MQHLHLWDGPDDTFDPSDSDERFVFDPSDAEDIRRTAEGLQQRLGLAHAPALCSEPPPSRLKAAWSLLQTPVGRNLFQ